MRYVLLVAMAVLVGSARSDPVTEATIGVANNYVWRGQTRTSDRPAVFGEVEHREERFRLALRTFNIEEAKRPPSYEIDLFAGYRFPVGPASLEAGAIRYEFPGGYLIDDGGTQIPHSEDDRDFSEFMLAWAQGPVIVRYWGSDDYFGSGQWSNYLELNYRYPVQSGAQLEFHYGIKQSPAVPDHGDKVADFGVAFSKGPLLLKFTNLTDNEDGLQSDNGRFTVAWQHCVGL